MIDLRSDTVTQPTPQMLKAMGEAELGDDVYGGDPTVRALEEKAASMLGKAEALFVPSGTMGNQLAVKLWTRPGQQIVVDSGSHLVLYEMASLALISSVAVSVVPTDRGWFEGAQVEERLDDVVVHGSTSTGLVSVENTHNRAGGTIFPQKALTDVARVCKERELPLHMDGARIFNAAVASGRPVSQLAAAADSVMFCLSKSLGCPVGSLLCGPSDFIAEARALRQVLGGGMRQAGVIAAAGLVALEHGIDRLADDHRRARRLAEGLAERGFGVDLDRVHTNIVYFDVAEPARPVVARLAEQGVLCFDVGPRTIRFVTHHHITDEDIEHTLGHLNI